MQKFRLQGLILIFLLPLYLLLGTSCQTRVSPTNTTVVSSSETSEKDSILEANPGLEIEEKKAEASTRSSGEKQKFRGRFIYYADAGIFFDCSSSNQWPVEQSGANQELEAQYLEEREVDMEEIYVEVIGRLIGPEGERKATYLRVDQVLLVDRTQKCP